IEPRLAGRSPRANGTLLGVDGDDDGLRAEPLRQLGDELGTLERRRVDRHLVRTGGEQLLRVVDGANPAADRERDRDALRDAPHELDKRSASVERRLHVEEHELVRPLVRVDAAQLDGISDVPQSLELHALDDAALRDVEARDQTRERHTTSSRYAAPSAPLFSGWNWQPTKEPCRTSATMPSDHAVALGVTAAYECAK